MLFIKKQQCEHLAAGEHTHTHQTFIRKITRQKISEQNKTNIHVIYI